jgi:hypothetical protein
VLPTSRSLTKNGSAKGAEFLTPPKQHAREISYDMRDPDGYLIQAGQTTAPM